MAETTDRAKHDEQVEVILKNLEPHSPAWIKILRRDRATLLDEISRLRQALEDLIEWLDADTLEILKDIPRTGITWDEKDRDLLRAEIEKARAALEGAN